MDIVKKNLVSILCGVVALASIIAIFFPLKGMYAAMTAEVDKSKKVGDDMVQLVKQNRTWPTLSTHEEDRVPLKHFPTAAARKSGTGITDNWRTQTDDFFNTALEFQARVLKPLVEGALPGGTTQQTLAYQFQGEYRNIFNLTNAGPLGSGNPYGGQPPQAGQPAVGAPMLDPQPVLRTPLVGRMPPTEADIKGQADAIELRISQTMPQRDSTGTVVNQDAVNAEIIKQKGLVGDRLRTDVALKSAVYVDPQLSFVASDRIVGNTAPAANDMFMAQVGLWLQQEICRAVYDTNKGSRQGVVDAPIKRLIAIRFILPYQLPPAPATGTPAPTDVPAIPATPPAAKVAVDYTRNPLGQVSNDLYDVLPFKLALVCDADSVPTTLTGLSANRYLLVRNVTVQSLDSGVAYAQGFLYGSKPVVQLSIDGEYLLLRKFSGPYMPPDIIRGLALPPGGGVAGGPPPPG